VCLLQIHVLLLCCPHILHQHHYPYPLLRLHIAHHSGTADHPEHTQVFVQFLVDGLHYCWAEKGSRRMVVIAVAPAILALTVPSLTLTVPMLAVPTLMLTVPTLTLAVSTLALAVPTLTQELITPPAFP
ncbi:hypothetical protein CVT25_000065, partial [Psilocybe cyanescens]